MSLSRSRLRGCHPEHTGTPPPLVRGETFLTLNGPNLDQERLHVPTSLLGRERSEIHMRMVVGQVAREGDGGEVLGVSRNDRPHRLAIIEEGAGTYAQRTGYLG